MGDAAYDARRAAERTQAEQRQRREALAEEVSVLLLESVKDFLERRSFIGVEEDGNGMKRIFFIK